MDFLGIKNNKFIKNKELGHKCSDDFQGDDSPMNIDQDTQLIVPESPNFKFITTIKRKSVR